MGGEPGEIVAKRRKVPDRRRGAWKLAISRADYLRPVREANERLLLGAIERSIYLRHVSQPMGEFAVPIVQRKTHA